MSFAHQRFIFRGVGFVDEILPWGDGKQFGFQTAWKNNKSASLSFRPYKKGYLTSAGVSL